MFGFHIYVIPWFRCHTLRGLFPESRGDKLRHRGGSWRFLVRVRPLEFRQRGPLLVIIQSPSEEEISDETFDEMDPIWNTGKVSDDEFDDLMRFLAFWDVVC